MVKIKNKSLDFKYLVNKQIQLSLLIINKIIKYCYLLTLKLFSLLKINSYLVYKMKKIKLRIETSVKFQNKSTSEAVQFKPEQYLKG